MDINFKKLQGNAIALLTGLATIGLPLVDNPSASAAQQLFCNGRMNNGWAYTATFLNGRFTEIRWEQAGQPPQTTTLTFSSTNPQGEPIYTGSFQAATTVTLVDLSRGNVTSGSQITVKAEEWGTSTGTCGLSNGGSTTNPSPPASQQLFCSGRMNNGWTYTAEYDNQQFTLIRWQRSGQPPQTTTLTRSGTNPKGLPTYQGSFQSATTVTLVDLSRGNVTSGSQITVKAEEWGASTGTCSLSNGGSTTNPSPPASQQLFCSGRMNNGWAYTAEYDNRQFTLIRWQRSGQPPQTTTLTRSGTNPEGQPIYQGNFQSATLVTLLDLSRGNVTPGSEVSVGVEEWGWARGQCKR